MDNVQKRIELLCKLINDYNDQYYQGNESEISDEEFDQYLIELQKLEAVYPQYKLPDSPTEKVGGKAENTFNQVVHDVVMLSLGKCMNIMELTKWFNEIKAKFVDVFNFEIKIDGLACKLIYEDGRLVLAATRGDGSVGEDITATAMLIPNIPKNINRKGHIEIRGEVFLTKTGFEEINKTAEKVYKNVRNAASGILRAKIPNPKLCKHLKFGAYMVLGTDEFDTHRESMRYLESIGFDTAASLVKLSFDDVSFIENPMKEIERVFKVIEGQRDSLDFDIDGVVIKAAKYDDQERLGYKQNIPNWATAFKFESMRRITQVVEVQDLLGNKGNITPRAVLNPPVEIGGSTITKPTLHNYEEIKRLGLKIGDYVVVERRGDVIPKITKVLTELRTGIETDVVVPTVCPECGEKLNTNGVFMRCDNPNCSGRQSAKIENFVRALEIEEYGPGIIQKTIDAGKVIDVADIFNLTIDDLAGLERMGKRSATKVVNNIQAAKNAPLYQILAGLTIKNVGVETGKDLANKYKTIDKFLNAKYDELTSIPGIGPETSQYIMNWLSDSTHKQLIEKLFVMGIGMVGEVVKELSSNKLGGKKFAFTGSLSTPRAKVEKLIEDNGGESFGIKKGLDYLILGDGGKEHKAERAKSYGAKIINEQEFLDMLK
jgi:DNA ligase (NAD+)